MREKYFSCTKNKISGSNFCRSHTCKEIGCMREVPAANERCSTHKSEYYDSIGISNYGKKTYADSKNRKKYYVGKNSNTYSNTYGNIYSNKSSSKKKTDPYHASDYSDYEDFYYDHMDDFEGIDDTEFYYEEHCE